MKPKILITTLVGFLLLRANVLAQGLEPLENSGTGLQEIKIPIFPVLFTDLSRYNTVLSWVTFAGGLLVSGVVIYWIYKIVRAGLKAIQAEGEADKITEARQQLQAALSGIAVTFLVPIVLSFVGIIFGFGTMFEWPKSFSGCTQPNRGNVNYPQADGGYQYYFQAFLQEGSEEAATAVCNPELANPDR